MKIRKVLYLFYLGLVIDILFHYSFQEPFQNLITLNDSFSGTNSDYQLDESTTLTDSNVNIGNDFIVLNSHNNKIDDDNIDFLKSIFGLSDSQTLDIYHYDGSDIECDSSSACYLGTGMKITFPKRSVVTDNITEEESVEDFDDILHYSEGGEAENGLTDDEVEYEQGEDTKEEQEVYYVIVIGDITGDGKVEINDIVKAKNQDKWVNKPSSVTNKVELNTLYKRALNIYQKESERYLEVEASDLAKSKVLQTELTKMLTKNATTVTIPQKELTMGTSDTYKVDVSSDNAASVTYTTSDQTIATVNEKGMVTARKKGEVTITATAGAENDTCTVKIVSSPKNVTFSQSVVNVVVGQTYKNSYQMAPIQNEMDTSLRYTSSNPNIASVSSDGTVTAISEGETTITATTVNNKTATYSVIVTAESAAELSSITVVDKVGTIEMNDSFGTDDTSIDGTVLVGSQFRLLASSSLSGNKSIVKWKSSNDAIATIDSDTGEVRTKKNGVVTFYVTNGHQVKTYTIAIYSVKLGSSNISLNIQQSETVMVQFLDEKNKTISIDDVNLSVDNLEEYYQTSILSNQITFTAQKEVTDPIICNISIDKLVIGRIEITIKDPINDTNGDVIFLPTQYKEDNGKVYSANESILLKSKDGSLALIDTANKDIKLCKRIVKYIHQYALASDTDYVTLKYLIVSHSHEDHTGCLSYLLENSYTTTTYLKIDKIIVKDESTASSYTNYSGKKSYSNVYNYIKANKNNQTSLVKVNNLKDNYVLNLGSGDSTMKLHLFNLQDTYAGEPKCKTSTGKYSYGRAIKFSYVKDNSTIDFLKVNGTNSQGKKVSYYPYLKQANSTDISFGTTKKSQQTINNIPAYFYAFDVGSKKSCNSNANSIAVLAEIPIGDNDARYVYLPSDIENNGYPFTGKTVSIGGKDVVITGNGSSYFYKYSSGKFTIKNNNFVSDGGKIVPRAREYKTALSISKVIDKNKIVIYQASHHSYNNDQSAIDLLNLNREDMIVVSLQRTNQKNSTSAMNVRSYYHNLSKVTSSQHRFYYTGKYFDTKKADDALEFSILNNGKVRANAIKSN